MRVKSIQAVEHKCLVRRRSDNQIFWAELKDWKLDTDDPSYKIEWTKEDVRLRNVIYEHNLFARDTFCGISTDGTHSAMYKNKLNRWAKFPRSDRIGKLKYANIRWNTRQILHFKPEYPTLWGLQKGSNRPVFAYPTRKIRTYWDDQTDFVLVRGDAYCGYGWKHNGDCYRLLFEQNKEGDYVELESRGASRIADLAYLSSMYQQVRSRRENLLAAIEEEETDHSFGEDAHRKGAYWITSRSRWREFNIGTSRIFKYLDAGYRHAKKPKKKWTAGESLWWAISSDDRLMLRRTQPRVRWIYVEK